jgi:ATP-binding cassette subfamily B multidrug efflux pump
MAARRSSAPRQTIAAEMRIITKMDLTLTILNVLLILSVTGWALSLWYHGEASVGMVTVATTLVLRLSSMTYWIMWSTTNLFENLGVVQEGMETITHPVTLVDAPGAPALQFHEGKIEIDHVSHHYGRGFGGLRDVSLTIRPGEKIGVVGRSGAGKSSLVKLMLRFYDTESGAIRIDGQNIADVTQESLRRVIGMVQQDSAPIAPVDPRQHPLWSPRCQRSRNASGGKESRCA